MNPLRPHGAVVARRRADALRGCEKRDLDGISRFIASLELPGAIGRLAPKFGWRLLLVLLLAAAAGGPVLLAMTIFASVAGTQVLRRGAPARRAAAIDRDLPLVLEAVARHLRGGGSLAQAIVAAGPTGGGALAVRWERLIGDVPAVGLVGALDRWTTDGSPPPRPAERLAAAALALAAETGGSPARAVDGVAATLRSRVALHEEIRALSSQARASAMVIGAAPLIFGALAGITDDRTAAFFRSSAGVTLLLAGVGLDVLGLWWMMRLCRSPA